MHATEPALTTGPLIQSLAAKEFHRQMITLARESLERFDKSQREIHGLSMSVSADCLKKAKKKIRTLQQELLEMTVNDPKSAEAVYQLNIQLFPLTSPQT